MLENRFNDPNSLDLLSKSLRPEHIARAKALVSAVQTIARPLTPTDHLIAHATLIDTDWGDAGSRPAKAKIDWVPVCQHAVDLCDHWAVRYLKHVDRLSDPSAVERMSRLARMRSGVAKLAWEAAPLPRGIYTLTAPLGTAKTRAAWLYGARHAAHHQMDRIIYVSLRQEITSQSAREGRDMFPSCHILDHQSSAPLDRISNLTEEESGDRLRFITDLKQCWDADIVVTTNIQFLESILHTSNGRTRKLANYSNSVIIFDEAHIDIPVEYRNVVSIFLNDLVETYGCTIVFVSATQSCWTPTKRKRGFVAHEINSDAAAMFENSVRVHMGNYGCLRKPVE